jgi:hypothetical protein
MLARDDRRLEAELRGADGGDVAAGPGADDGKIEARIGHGALLSATAAASWSLSKSCERKTSA